MHPLRFNEACLRVWYNEITEASAVLITMVAYDAVDSLINMVASSYTSEGVLK